MPRAQPSLCCTFFNVLACCKAHKERRTGLKSCQVDGQINPGGQNREFWCRTQSAYPLQSLHLTVARGSAIIPTQFNRITQLTDSSGEAGELEMTR